MVQTCGDAPNIASSAVTFTPTDFDIHKALGQWLLTALPAPFSVRLGQQNRTASPVGPYCLMQQVTSQILATNGSTYSDAARVVTELREITVQVSAFGIGAGDALRQVAGLWRDFYATDWFRENADILSPLWAGEPRQMGFITAENQYEDQWSVDLKMQVNFTRTIPQQFADAITATLIEVDTTYLPTE